MKLIELSKEDFKIYAYEHEQANFHQTLNWAKLKENNGWSAHYLGLKDNDKVAALTLMLGKKTPFGYMYYCPRGFLIDYKDKKLLAEFTKQIKKYAEKNKGIFIKIDPYVEYQERDKYGNLVESGFNNIDTVKNLKDLGYKHFGFNLLGGTLQPRWIYVIDINGRNNEELMKDMESKTRQMIRKNENNCIKIRELTIDELNIWKDIMKHTSERRNFIDRPLSYYKNMYDELNKDNMVKYVVSELHAKEARDNTITEIKKEEKELILKEKQLDSGKVNKEKTIAKIEQIKKNITRLGNKEQEFNKLIEEKGEVIILGGIEFIVYKDEIVTLFGGSYKELMKYQSQYTAYYEMLKYAAENNFKRYNFYGITGNLTEEDPQYGIYLFKRGFGGRVVELIGEFDLVISKPKFLLYNLSYKIYRAIKKIIK